MLVEYSVWLIKLLGVPKSENLDSLSVFITLGIRTQYPHIGSMTLDTLGCVLLEMILLSRFSPLVFAQVTWKFHSITLIYSCNIYWVTRCIKLWKVGDQILPTYVSSRDSSHMVNTASPDTRRPLFVNYWGVVDLHEPFIPWISNQYPGSLSRKDFWPYVREIQAYL